MKKKFNPIIIAFLIPVIAVVLALVFILAKKTSPSSAAEFPISSYLTDAQSLYGNKYVLRAQIDSVLASNERGRILSIRTTSGARLSVFIPSSLQNNIHTGQRYDLYVNILEDGLINVNGMEKY